MKKTLVTDWQSLEKILEDAVTESLRGDNWKKFAQLESKPTNKQDLDRKATPPKDSHSPQKKELSKQEIWLLQGILQTSTNLDELREAARKLGRNMTEEELKRRQKNNTL